jgi:putative DNA primase/helicase
MLGEDYYDEVFLELEHGGTEAFYWYLLHEVDTSRFHPKKRPPMTDAKRALIHISLPSEQRFAEEWLSGDTPWPVCPCRAGDFYTAYTRWCRTNGEARPRPSNQFLGSIARLPGWAKEKRRIHPEESPANLVLRPIVLPPREALQAHGTDHPPHESQTAWLTGTVVRFSESLKGQQWADP